MKTSKSVSHKKYLFPFLILGMATCSLSAISPVASNEQQEAESSAYEPFIDSSKFTFFDVTNFELRDWYWETIEDSLIAFTSLREIEHFFQDERSKEVNVFPEYFHYFSVQKNTKQAKTIAVVVGNGYCCSNVHLLNYDYNNRLISDNIVAGTGSDGMTGYDYYGYFMNDSTYQLTQIDMEEIELDGGGADVHIDSTITQYRFHPGKSFEQLSEETHHKIERIH